MEQVLKTTLNESFTEPNSEYKNHSSNNPHLKQKKKTSKAKSFSPKGRKH